MVSDRAGVGHDQDERGGRRNELARLGTPPREQGGEAACYTHLLCPDCGAVLDGGPHRPGCASD